MTPYTLVWDNASYDMLANIYYVNVSGVGWLP